MQMIIQCASMHFVPRLHYAAYAQNDQTNVAKFLIRNGATIDAKDKYENTPLHLAARSGNLGVAKLLIEKSVLALVNY